MPAYRLYLLDRHSGHIDRVEEMNAGDDVEAICVVQDRAGELPMELWLGGRKVRRFDARPEVSPPSPPRASAGPLLQVKTGRVEPGERLKPAEHDPIRPDAMDFTA